MMQEGQITSTCEDSRTEGMRIFLTIGGPGTGKTYTINQIAKTTACHLIAPTNASLELLKCIPTNQYAQTIYNFCNRSIDDLSSSTKQFKHHLVIVDEIFMITREQMEQILRCCQSLRKKKESKLMLFGDPFQIKQLKQDYFYNAMIPESGISLLQYFIENKQNIQHLDVYHRASDPQLQQILIQYRISKQATDSYVRQTFQHVDVQQAIQKVILKHHSIIVGTHKQKHYYKKCISNFVARGRTFGTGDVGIGSDGNVYRKGETIYTLSAYGAVAKRFFIHDFERELTGQLNIIATDGKNLLKLCPSLKDGKMQYEFISGDVITVNVSQGRTLDGVVLDLESLFEFGSFYTAISRVKKLADISILSYQKETFEVDLENWFADVVDAPSAKVEELYPTDLVSESE